jgi:hypothetical protein
MSIFGTRERKQHGIAGRSLPCESFEASKLRCRPPRRSNGNRWRALKRVSQRTDLINSRFSVLSATGFDNSAASRTEPPRRGLVAQHHAAAKNSRLTYLEIRHSSSIWRSIDTVWADLSVTGVGWSARERAAQSTLKRAAVQPKVDLHREPGILDRVVQIASTSELDVAADRAQRSAAAEVERAVSFHGAVDGPGERGQPCRD